MRHTNKLNTPLAHSVFMSMIIGLITAIASHYFREGIASFDKIRIQELSQFSNFYSYLITLSFAGLLIIAIKKVSKVSRFEGPADTIYYAHRTDNQLNLKTGFLSTLAAFISASGGASVGQYGPIVHFGATIGALCKSKIKTHLTPDIFIGCGVAAAIASGFAAPIAGVLFAHEAITRHFSLKAITPISISSGIAYVASEFIWSVDAPFEDISEPTATSLRIIAVSSIIIAPIFGLGAVFFMISLERMHKFANSINLDATGKITLAVFILSLLGAFLPEAMGLGTNVVGEMISQSYSLQFLMFLFIGKIFATTLSLSFGFFGGVFSPALFAGASLGALVAEVLRLTGVGMLDFSSLVVCGMASIAGAVIGAPLTATILVLELTQSYALSLAALVSIVISVMISNRFYGHSYFDKQLLNRGIDLSHGRAGLMLMEIHISDHMTNTALTLPPELTSKTAIDKMKKAETSEAFIIGEDYQFLGKIYLSSIIGKNPSTKIENLVEKDVIFIHSNASLQEAIETAANFVGETIPIIEPFENKYVGSISEGDIFSAYLDFQNQILDLEKK